MRPAESLIAPSLQIGEGEGEGFVGDRGVVDARAAAADQAAGFAVAGGEAGEREEAEGGHAVREIGRGGRVMVGRVSAASPVPRRARRAVSAALGGGVGAVGEGGRFGCEDFLGLVDVGTAQRFQPSDFGQRQVGEQAQEAADVGVLGVAPELPVIVGREAVGGEPDGAVRRFCPSSRRRRW